MLKDLPDNKGKTLWPWSEESSVPEGDAVSWPKITIVTPSFNQGRYIEETIRSVLLQNYPNLEYMIIDGGSSDETLEVIKKYEKWITYWVSEEDNGQSHAINKGFKRATGEIISWLNSDDQLAKGSLYAIASAFINNPQYSFIYGQRIEYDENHIHPYQHLPTDNLPLRYHYGFPWSQPSCFLKRLCLTENGYVDERFDYTMDLDLFLRIALRYEMIQIDDILSLGRHHKDSKTSKIAHVAMAEQITVFMNLMSSIKFIEGYSLLERLGFKTLFRKDYTVIKQYSFEYRYEILFEFLIPYLNRWYINMEYHKVRGVFSFFRKLKPSLLQDVRIRRKVFMTRLPDSLINTFHKFR